MLRVKFQQQETLKSSEVLGKRCASPTSKEKKKSTPFLLWIRKGFNSLACPFRLNITAYINPLKTEKENSAFAKMIKPFFKGFLNGNLSTGEK